MIRLWSFLGPTTNRSTLIICSFFGRVDVYLLLVVALGNTWLLFCMLLQRSILQKLLVAAIPDPVSGEPPG